MRAAAPGSSSECRADNRHSAHLGGQRLHHISHKGEEQQAQTDGKPHTATTAQGVQSLSTAHTGGQAQLHMQAITFVLRPAPRNTQNDE